jgi:hypothetical protein
MRQNMGKSMDQKGAALPYCDGRIEENTAAAVVDSDEGFRRPGGFSGSGKRGKGGRRWRAICSRR